MRRIIRVTCIVGLIGVVGLEPVLAERWQTLVEAESEKALIDLDSIERRGDLLAGSAREIDHQPQRVQKDHRFVFDCQNRRGVIVESSAFIQTASGDIQLKSYEKRPDPSPQQFEPILPGTYGDALLSFACTWQAMREKAMDRLPLMR